MALGCAERRAAEPAPSSPEVPGAPPESGASAEPAPAEAPPLAPIELDGVLNRSLLVRLGVPEAWAHSRGDGVIVAVMDNGFYPDDPAMAGAYLDEELRFENVVHRQDVMCAAHGSAMAATIAARPRGPGGIIGIAPEAKILRLSFGCPKWVEMDIKSLPKGEQDRLHLEYLHETAVQGARALDWAADKGAKIISFSTTMVPPNPERLPESLRLAALDVQAFEQAMQRARARGVLVIAAAGNWTGIKEKADQAEWLSRYPEEGLYFPASSAAALAVGCACGDPGQTCEYVHSGSEIGQPQIASVRLSHNYGQGLDFVGYCDGVPGVIKKGTELVYHVAKEGGTSNAVPELAGVLALAWAAAPRASADAIVDSVRASCTDLGVPGPDDRFGCGVPNAGRAVERARALH